MKKRADGRLVKKFTDPKTKKSVYFYGKTMAEINRKMLDYTYAQETGRTFKAVADEWWGETLEKIAHNTNCNNN